MIPNNYIWFYSFIFSVCSASLITQLECINSSECSCFRNNENMEWTCPPNEESVNVTVSFRERENPTEWLMDINCYNCEDVVDILPNRNTPMVTHIKLQSCSLPSNGFKSLLEKFNIDNLQSFNFVLSDCKPLVLKKYDFSAMGSLSEFKFNTNNLDHMDEHIFENFPYLESLDLRHNNLSLNESLFKYAQNIKVLDISENNIEYLPAGIFKTLHKLELLDMWSNKITELQENSFLGLNNLQSLELSNNRISYIDSKTFSHFGRLLNISLRYNKIQVIQEDLFRANQQLKLIDLSNNKLEGIPENVFTNCANLTILDLSNNKLQSIPGGLFRNLSSLEVLDLHGNKIIELINENLFLNLRKLRTIRLQQNVLTTVSHILLSQLKKVTHIDMSSNQLTEFEVSGLEFLEVLDLSYNDISQVDFQGIMVTLQKLKRLDLSHNSITTIATEELKPIFFNITVEVDLSYNDIASISFPKNINNISASEESTVKLYLAYNPIVCDCDTFDLMRYFKQHGSPYNKMIHISPDGLICQEPLVWKGLQIAEFPLQKFTCSLRSIRNCSVSCGCSWRPFDKTVMVDCVNKSLTDLPDITLLADHKKIRLDLTGNSLEILSKKRDYDDFNIIALTLSSNAIENITWIPPNIKILKLDNNRIKRLEYPILEVLNSSNSLVNLTLDNNPWICDCQTKNFSNFLRSNSEKVDPFSVFCWENHQVIFSLNEEYLCYQDSMSLVVSVCVIAVTLLFLILLAVLCYNFRRDIKIWLFSKNLCLAFITEEDLDKDKEYDAFISFSHKDGELIENMVEILENGPCSYKLCLHYRDWVPGEYIASQIINSVQNSKRTIIVLSSNFLESVWAKMEFQAAHLQAIKERRAKVIIILYGNIDTDKLDEELKLYLNINTYVKWGDPWFWNKLRYALPHENKKKQLNVQKHANMMMSIDRQFSSKHPLHESQIAPVLPLDAESLLKHPLSLISRDAAEDCDNNKL